MKTFDQLGIEIPFRRNSGKVKTTCPHCSATRHNPRDRSLSVDLDRGLWKCHHCGWSGALSQYSAPKAYAKQEYKKPAQHAIDRSSASKMSTALNYVRSRKISAEAIAQAPIEFDGSTVRFVYECNGERINEKTRSATAKRFSLVEGAELIPWNIDAVRDTEECIITEGEFDAMAFMTAGRFDVVSVPNGGGGDTKYFDDFMEGWFDHKKTIYIASDEDPVGRQLAKELVKRFGRGRCRMVSYGEGCKDANEHLQKYGAESLLECLTNAERPVSGATVAVGDHLDEAFAIVSQGQERGVNCGLPNLDAICRLELGRLCVVTGRPGSGKSEFIDEIVTRMAINHGWGVAYFSPENMPVGPHFIKLAKRLLGHPLTGEDATNEANRRAWDFIKQHFFHIVPEEDALIDVILEEAKDLVLYNGVRTLVIDPYNELQDDYGSATETTYVSRLLTKLKRFAMGYGVLVVLVAHPRQQRREMGDSGLDLYSISGSAHFYNKTDYGMIISRNRENGVVEVRVDKVKFSENGLGGAAQFTFDSDSGRYLPILNDRAERCPLRLMQNA